MALVLSLEEEEEVGVRGRWQDDRPASGRRAPSDKPHFEKNTVENQDGEGQLQRDQYRVGMVVGYLVLLT